MIIERAISSLVPGRSSVLLLFHSDYSGGEDCLTGLVQISETTRLLSLPLWLLFRTPSSLWSDSLPGDQSTAFSWSGCHNSKSRSIHFSPFMFVTSPLRMAVGPSVFLYQSLFTHKLKMHVSCKTYGKCTCSAICCLIGFTKWPRPVRTRCVIKFWWRLRITFLFCSVGVGFRIIYMAGPDLLTCLSNRFFIGALRMSAISYLWYYCKRGHFRVGISFAFFAILTSSRKSPPPFKNKTQMILWRKIWVVSWKLPPYERSCQYFRENFPQRK